MKTRLFHHDSGFWIQIIALTVAGLLLTLWPDWGHAPRAQTVSPTVSPTSHNFGTVIVGNTRGPVVFTVNNLLLTNMIINSVQATAPFLAANGCPGVLAPGASCTIQVSFTPVGAGNQSGTLSIDWDTALPPPPPGEVNPSGTLIANLTGVGALPLVAVNDSATTPRNTAVNIAVLANDSGGVPPLNLQSVTTPAHGAAAISGSVVVYTPAAGYTGPDSFGYTVRDATGQTASATVTVTVKEEEEEEDNLEDSTDNPNAKEVGGVISNLCSNEAASTNFLRDCKALIDSPDPGSALEQITPNTVGNAPNITQINAQTQMLNIQSRLSFLRAGIMGIDIERLNIQRGGWTLSGRDLRYLLASVDGGGTPSAEVTSTDLGAFGIFASGSLNFGDRNGTENQTGFDFRTFALAVGIDYRFTERLVLGTAFSYVANDNNSAGNGGSLDTRGYSLSLYGTYYQSDNFYIEGIIDYGWNDYDQQRNVHYRLPGVDVQQRFTSQYSGKQFFVDLGAGYNFTRDNWIFGPKIRLSYLDMQVDSFRERVNNDGPGSA